MAKTEEIHADIIRFIPGIDELGHYVEIRIISKKYEMELYVYISTQDEVIRILGSLLGLLNIEPDDLPMYG